jgi:hypothetical protein
MIERECLNTKSGKQTMKINEILNYHQDQQLLRHIGDAFMPNGELKFPVDFAGLVPDAGSMHDQTADEVPDDITDVATVDQRPKSIRQTPRISGVAPARSLSFSSRSSGLLATNGREWSH